MKEEKPQDTLSNSFLATSMLTSGLGTLYGVKDETVREIANELKEIKLILASK